MPEVDRLAMVSVRAADLADRCEAAGALVAAAVLRGIAAPASALRRRASFRARSQPLAPA